MDMEEAMDNVSEQFSQTDFVKLGEKNIIIEVSNLHSKKRDQLAKAIETQLYQALGKHFSEFKLLFLEDSLAGISLTKSIFIKGQYELEDEQVVANFKALIGMNGEAVAQAKVSFDKKKIVDDALVAVLDIEAGDLNGQQKKAFSDLFRSKLAQSGTMNLASSADVSKMNPEAIQKSYGCTRDECATLIAEQLGVDRVVSVSVFKMSETKMMLSAKMMDVKNGSILASETVEHTGGIDTLGKGLHTLAEKMTGGSIKAETTKALLSNVAKHLGIGVAAVVSLSQSDTSAKKYNKLAKENAALSQEYAYANTQAELEKIKAQYSGNQKKMTQLKQQVLLFNSLSLACIGWEAYLYFMSAPAAAPAVALDKQLNKPQWALYPPRYSGETARMNVEFRW